MNESNSNDLFPTNACRQTTSVIPHCNLDVTIVSRDEGRIKGSNDQCSSSVLSLQPGKQRAVETSETMLL